MSLEPRGCTLWELAVVVGEEVEKVFREELFIREASNLVLGRLLLMHVKNVELVEDEAIPERRGAHAEP
jgi:hypothetical protein